MLFSVTNEIFSTANTAQPCSEVRRIKIHKNKKDEKPLLFSFFDYLWHATGGKLNGVGRKERGERKKERKKARERECVCV